MEIIKQKDRSKFFRTAGITFEIRSEYPVTDITFHPKLLLFQTGNPGHDHFVINHFFTIPDRLKQLNTGEALASVPMWTIFKKENSWIYKKNQALPMAEKNIAFFELEDNSRSCRVYSDFLNSEAYSKARFSSLTLFGYDQLMITRLLAERQGMVLHANSFVHKGSGMLLAGTSGAGKTTLSRMLKDRGFQVTSDDRMIVKFEQNKMMMYGSWLHGTTPLVTKGVQPLDSIFFLEHADRNQIIKIDENHKKIGAILQAMVRPHVRGETWRRLLETVENMVKTVTCYRLLFDLSGEITDVIDEL